MIEIEGEVGQLQERNRSNFFDFVRTVKYMNLYVCVCVDVFCTGRRKEKKEKEKKERKEKKGKEKKKRKIRNWVGFYNF